ncbi:uncharacterized protein LOC125810092 isoform X2 [Solanum verrucosum]|uniref:uncharacterized protein LOC125810092 isoform X2 n=1 Tax=Solanum verrucosum TaxID=315347 RepID=UPI0020D154D6|nr:uncharacterized protein LOC125810092 isoform X2 [Solanum verrucosum]
MRASIMAVASTKKKSVFVDRVTCGVKVKQIAFMGIICTIMFLIVYRTTNYQYQQTEMESKSDPFYSSKDSDVDITHLNSLPRGIIQASSDLELKPLWSTSNSKSKGSVSSSRNLLAMAVGIKQKKNVDTLVQKSCLMPDLL